MTSVDARRTDVNLSSLADACDAWRDVLGQEHTVVDPDSLSAASTATFATFQRVHAILRPGSTDEVQACLGIANRYGIPLYPVARGRNWGLGSRVPPRTDSVILELSRLNRILDYDERLGYMTVEPGVSFREASLFLREHGSPWFLSIIAGPADASIIGNLVERGDGVGPYGDRLDTMCDLEVVLPTGECIHTGFGRFAGARATPVHRAGVGPFLDGIFTQSNLGIVTRATVALMRTPECPRVFTLAFSDTSMLAPLTDAVRGLVERNILQCRSLYLWNAYKRLTRDGQFPWELTGGRTPLVLAALGLPEPWHGFGAIYAPSRKIGLLQSDLIAEALSGCVDELIFHDQDSAQTFAFDYFMGIPSDGNLGSPYWRKKIPIPASPHPDRDRCGVIWLCPSFRLDGAELASAMSLIETMMKEHSFEPNLAMCNGMGRVMLSFLQIAYDREVAGEDERAMACHDALLQALVERGHIPYRLGIQSMESLPRARDDYGLLLSRLKRSLDPNDILAPGRYDFRPDWPSPH